MLEKMKRIEIKKKTGHATLLCKKEIDDSEIVFLFQLFHVAQQHRVCIWNWLSLNKYSFILYLILLNNIYTRKSLSHRQIECTQNCSAEMLWIRYPAAQLNHQMTVSNCTALLLLSFAGIVSATDAICEPLHVHYEMHLCDMCAHTHTCVHAPTYTLTSAPAHTRTRKHLYTECIRTYTHIHARERSYTHTAKERSVCYHSIDNTYHVSHTPR